MNRAIASAALAVWLIGAPVSVLAVCGNAVIEPSEECDDGNAVAGDCCAPDCTYEQNGLPCEHPDACFGTGVCDIGECLAAEPVGCDDGNECTSDRCDSDAGGCIAEGIAGCCVVDADCDDGVVCNGFEACQLSGPGPTGSCVAATEIPCDDGDPVLYGNSAEALSDNESV